ncbi:hypothetical protein C2G38_2251039 [Gigaspora rosea]|uniref:F-box/LRR-repeat protein 15-like leucin rich repeat domain-containing protein n=1 Tax=Gigaspora rosea TaxID=44941 RepID=A0A397ULH9_9GLOM|nr:hypothetical protein C2G38_2251039 [Gigaspora rosea]
MDLTGFINVTDSGVMHLAGARSLTFLSLSGMKLTDVGMSALKGLRDLTHLSLNKTRIKNSSLSTIRKSTFANRKLKYLDVGYTRITDKGVKELRDILSLQSVRLNGITKESCEDEYYEGLYVFGMFKFSGHIYKC